MLPTIRPDRVETRREKPWGAALTKQQTSPVADSLASMDRAPLPRRGSMLVQKLQRSRTPLLRELDDSDAGPASTKMAEDDEEDKLRPRRSVWELTRAASITLRPLSPRSSTHRLTFEGVSSGAAALLRERFPVFAPMAYDANAPHSALNALTLVHNAAQRELVELVRDALPLCERAANGALCARAQSAVLKALAAWWGVFEQFSDFVAHVQAAVVARLFEKMAGEELVRLGRDEVQSAERARDRILERTGHSRVLVFESTRDCIADGAASPRPAVFLQVVRAVNLVVGFLLDTYESATTFAREAELRLRRPKMSGIAVHVLRKLKDLQPRARATLTVMLVRWMDDDDLIRSWIGKYLGSRARRKLPEWMEIHEVERANVLSEIKALSV